MSIVAAAERDRARTGDAEGGRRAGTQLWREYLAAPDTHPHIPNVSYAGYHRGEDRLPQPPVRSLVTTFGAVGDGTTDSTAAFNTAIEAGGRAGGGRCWCHPAGTG